MSSLNYDYVLIKKTFSFTICKACDGSGRRKREFRKMKFIEDCPDCNGEGRTRHETEEVVPLTEALKDLGLLKDV